MQISVNTGHISFLFEPQDTFFELGYKVLQKQRLPHMLPFLKIKYNGKNKLLYNTENDKYLLKAIYDLDESAILDCLISMLELQIELEKNGFIPKEAIQLDGNYLFWNEENKSIDCIVLPISVECNIGNGRNWYTNYMETIKTLAGVLPENSRNRILQLVTSDTYLREPMETMQLLEGMKLLAQGSTPGGIEKQTNMMGFDRTLVLNHMGQYGQFAFYISKPEFIIGKKAESVDGVLNVSSAVSRMHCKIVRKEQNYYITDLGSVNHTYVNGIIVMQQEYKQITQGDRIRIADVEFVVQ